MVNGESTISSRLPFTLYFLPLCQGIPKWSAVSGQRVQPATWRQSSAVSGQSAVNLFS